MITAAEHTRHAEAVHMETRSPREHTATQDAEMCHLITQQAYRNVQPLFEVRRRRRQLSLRRSNREELFITAVHL